MNAEKILCVDDDPNVLSAFRRNLRKQFHIETADGGEEGLEVLSESGPFAVVVSDLRMPGMSGIEFLTRVREREPDSVRIMLTGHADLEVAMDAINEGNIFRFLTKPCPPFVLSKALSAGITQYRLVRAEKELLENTLSGSIKVLTDVLSLANPVAFGRSSRVRRLVKRISAELEIRAAWRLEIAAMLSQIGCITIPEATLAKAFKGKQLSDGESRMLQGHPRVGRNLLANIPRLEGVAEMVALQEKRFDDSGDPNEDDSTDQDVLRGASVLKVALDFDTLISSGLSEREAMMKIVIRGEKWYDPAVVDALKRTIDTDEDLDMALVALSELTLKMRFAEDVLGASGILLIATGQDVTPSLRLRLENYAEIAGIREPIKVLVKSSSEAGRKGD